MSNNESVLNGQRRILLAEAEPASRRLISWTLRIDGYNVDEIATAADLRAADLGRYELVIASTELVDASGLECSELAAVGRSLIVMNRSPSEACAETYRAATCIHRPIYVDELRGAVTACQATDDDPGEISRPIAIEAGIEATA